MAKKVKPLEVPEHFAHHLGYLRQWAAGFEAAEGKGPVHIDVLRQIQIWLIDYDKRLHQAAKDALNG